MTCYRAKRMLDNYIIMAKKLLLEDLSLKQIQNISYMTGGNNVHLNKFYKQRLGLMGKANTQIKFIESELLIQDDGAAIFRFLAEATEEDKEDWSESGPKKELRKMSNYNSKGNHLVNNPSRLYEMELLIRDFYTLLEVFADQNDEGFTKEYLSQIIEASQSVALFCSCASHLYQAGCFYLSQLNGAIRPTNIAPKKWNLIRGDVKLCKHLRTLVNKNVLNFMLPQLSQSIKAELQKHDLIPKK
jgi:hypothetical protein